MLPFQKIVFPVDYSNPCVTAAPYVKQWVHQFEAQLSLIHAYGAEALADSNRAVADPSLPEAVREAECRRVQEFGREHFPAIHVEAMAMLGEPGSVIRDFVQHQRADLLMLPTHGRGPFRRLLLGSVTAKLLHDVSAAIWTATPDVLKDAPRACKSILCACSMNDQSDAEIVVRAANALALKFDAHLSLMTNVELVPISSDIDWVSLQKQLRNAAHAQLRELKATLGIDAPHYVTEGFVARAAREMAARTNADLIVVGRGRDQGALSRLWSNLYTIVREAPCPVVSI